MSKSLDVEDEMLLTGWTLGVSRLIALDEMWTRWLSSAELSEADMRNLVRLGTKMITALDSITGQSIAIARHLISARSEAAFHTLEGILGELTDGEKSSPALASIAAFHAAHDLESHAGKALDAVNLNSVAEAGRVTEKIQVLREGRWAQGDFDHAFVCQLTTSCFYGSLALSVKKRDSWYMKALASLRQVIAALCIEFT